MATEHEKLSAQLRLEDVRSPLPENGWLRELLDQFDTRWASLDAGGLSNDDAATEAHFAEVEALANHLCWQADAGAFDQFDWDAGFVADSRIRNLYRFREDAMLEIIRDDLEEFLRRPDWHRVDLPQLSWREVDNLITVLKQVPVEGSDEAIRLAEHQRLVSR